MSVELGMLFAVGALGLSIGGLLGLAVGYVASRRRARVWQRIEAPGPRLWRE